MQPPRGQGDPSSTHYRLSLVAVWLAVLALFLSWLFNRPPGMEGVVNRFLLPPVILFLTAVALTLHRRPAWIGRLTSAVMIWLAIHLLLRLSLVLFVFSPGEDPRPLLSLHGPWIPVFILALFAMEKRHALRLAILFWVGCVGIAGVYVLVGPAASREFGVRYFLLHQYVLANAGYVVLAYWMMRIRMSESEARAKAVEYNHLAHTDSLTQVGNRRYVRSVLESRLQQSSETAILLCDIDHFKAVNDQHGHDIGDHVLRQFSAVVRQTVRAEDVFGRWGGEEFIVITAGHENESTESLAHRILERVRTHDFSPAGRVTVSIGVATSQPGEKFEALIRRADQALYRAKAEGRDRFVHERRTA